MEICSKYGYEAEVTTKIGFISCPNVFFSIELMWINITTCAN